MSFAFVQIENFFNLIVHSFIDSFEILRNILVHSAFADAEPFCRRSDGRLVFDNIGSENRASFFRGGYVHHFAKYTSIQLFFATIYDIHKG